MALISIIVPMRNAEKYVAATLRSLLQQDRVTFEVIVINDGSTDHSTDIVQSLGDDRVRLLDGPSRGISAAFNLGLAVARGEFLCRCDADDLYPNGRLARQANWLRDHPDFGAVCGSITYIDSAGRYVAERFADERAGEDTQDFLRGKGRSHLSGYLFRTEIFRRIGGCREWFVTAEDSDIQYRFAEIARVWFDPECVYLYRLHGPSVTHTIAPNQREFFEDMARKFLFQRCAGGMDDLQRGCPPPIPPPRNMAQHSARAHIQDVLIGEAWRQHRMGRRGRSIATGLRACVVKPTMVSAWKSLIGLMMKSSSYRQSHK